MRVDALQNAENILTSESRGLFPGFLFAHMPTSPAFSIPAHLKEFNRDSLPCKFFLLSFSHSLQQRYSVFWEFHIRI